MILNAEIVKQILANKRQMIRVPVKGREPKPGRVYAIRATKDQLIRCHITITSVLEREVDAGELVWEIRFLKGDHRDQPRLLAARWQPGQGDYTDNASRSLRGTADEVSEALQARFAAQAQEKRALVLAEQSRRLQSALGAIRKESTEHGYGSAEANARLRIAEEKARAIRRGLLYAAPKSRAS